MRKRIKRLLAFMLTLAMCVSTTGVGVSAYAEENVVTDKVNTEDGWDGVTTVNNYTGENFTVTFSLASYWEGGYNATVKVENTGNSVIENWYLSFALENNFSSIWNAEVVSNENGQYVVKNANWNADIPVGGCVEFGISVNETFAGFPKEYKLLGESTQVQEDAYSVEYILDSDWGSGFTARILVTNNSETTIENWTLEFDTENEINDLWGGIIESYSNNHYVVRNPGYHQNILPGESITIGFNADNCSSGAEFMNFVLSQYSGQEVGEDVPQRDKEPLEGIGDAYVKEPTIDDIIFDVETGIQYVKNQLLISAYMGADKVIFEEIAQEVGAEIVGYIALTNDYQFEFIEDHSLEEMIIIAEYIDSFSFVSSVSLNIASLRNKEITASNDTLYNDNQTCYKKYYMYDTDGDGVVDKAGTDFSSVADVWDDSDPQGDNWGLEVLRVPTAWDDKASFSPVRVGVYDLGFDNTHNDLIFDDVVNNATADNDKVHGTHVSGILAAQHNNNRGVSGIATDTRLYAYGAAGREYGSSMGDKLAYATLVGNHVKVINVSLGMPQEVMFAASHPEINSIHDYAIKAQNYIQSEADILSEYLNKLLTAGYDFVICTSAGNTNDNKFVVDISQPYGVREAADGEIAAPSIIKYSGNVLAYYDCALTAITDDLVKSRIIVVGSMKRLSDGSYAVSDFSNVGARVDVVAPGEDILSTVPTTEDPLGYGLKSGTSMASPYVASLVAMLYQVNPAIKGSLVKTYLKLGSTQSIKDDSFFYSIPNAVRSCTYARNAYTPNNNDNSLPSGIVCGFSKDSDGNVVSSVKITAIRESTGEYNLAEHCFTFESDSAGYYLQTLPQGTYSFVISKDGYLPYSIQGIAINPDETTYMENIVLSKWLSLAYTGSAVQGTVKDALKGTAVSGATVKLRKGWNNTSGAYVKNILGIARSVTTKEDGTFKLNASVGTYTAEISKNGYVTGYYNMISGDTGSLSIISQATMVLTPILSDDEYRIVLTWGSSPNDLDSHLTYYVDGTQKCHVYYSNKIGIYNGERIAQLDLDDTSSYGPETVTITLNASLIENGSEFKYSVHDFSGKSSSTSNALSLSNATVRVYAGNDMIKTFNVPKDMVGTVWHVFDITEEGIKTVNEFYNATSATGVK